MDALDLSLMTASLVTFFVVIDPIGVAPIFASLTEGSTNAHRRVMAIKWPRNVITSHKTDR